MLKRFDAYEKKRLNISLGLLKRLKDVLKIFTILLTNNIDKLKPESKKLCSVMFNLIMSHWIVKLLRFNGSYEIKIDFSIRGRGQVSRNDWILM